VLSAISRRLFKVCRRLSAAWRKERGNRANRRASDFLPLVSVGAGGIGHAYSTEVVVRCGDLVRVRIGSVHRIGTGERLLARRGVPHLITPASETEREG